MSLMGVISAKPGYSGGRIPNPTYEQVIIGKTGHAEVTEVEFNPGQISFEVLLSVFFSTHDPTTVNRQEGDIGEQYRSVIFYTSEEQNKQAEDFIKQLEVDKVFSNSIVTQIEPFQAFYEAEDYHKNYYERNKDKPYCQVVINPKLAKLKQKFASLIKI